tara:strand:+ start:1840 stop:1941 length:102 start_codon:yes stop_codon:yes gene_type:complete
MNQSKPFIKKLWNFMRVRKKFWAIAYSSADGDI